MTCQNAWVTFISYNTKKFLQYKLDELYQAHKIEFYYFVKHLPEADEKKSHIHLTIKTNGRFDTMEFQDYVREPDPNNKLPLQCVGPRKFIDNDDIRNGKFLYDKHDRKYLDSIGESRQYHYQWSEFTTSNQEEFDYYIEILRYPKSTIMEINEAMDRGETVYNLIRTGKVPLTQINFVKSFQELGKVESLERAKHENHEYAICKICGEVKHLSEFHGTLEYRIDKRYPIGTCYKCLYEESQK